jgi:hypothetical protein
MLTGFLGVRDAWAVALVCALTSGCAGSPQEASPARQSDTTDATPSAPGKAEDGVTADCRPWATAISGPFRYTNDQWGANKAKSGFEQCLLSREGASGIEYGWSWHWPGFDETVFAYPSITFGWKPWTGGLATDPRFPLRVADVKRLELHYEVETQAEGVYNLAPEIWFTKTKPAAGAAGDPSSITREVMLWMDFGGGATPAGSVVGHPVLGGVRYEFWKEENIGKEANGVGWTLLTFKSPAIARKASLPLHELLQHLVETSLLPPDEFVASVELGNEIMGGRGTTWIKRLELIVEP